MFKLHLEQKLCNETNKFHDCNNQIIFKKNFNAKINGIPIERFEECKYLDVVIDKTSTGNRILMILQQKYPKCVGWDRNCAIA